MPRERVKNTNMSIHSTSNVRHQHEAMAQVQEDLRNVARQRIRERHMVDVQGPACTFRFFRTFEKAAASPAAGERVRDDEFMRRFRRDRSRFSPRVPEPTQNAISPWFRRFSIGIPDAMFFFFVCVCVCVCVCRTLAESVTKKRRKRETHRVCNVPAGTTAVWNHWYGRHVDHKHVDITRVTERSYRFSVQTYGVRRTVIRIPGMRWERTMPRA